MVLRSLLRAAQSPTILQNLSANATGNSFSTVETASDSSWEGTLAPGKIKINARVTVKFVLE